VRKKGGWPEKRIKKEEIQTRIEQKELWPFKVWASASFQRVMGSAHNPTTSLQKLCSGFVEGSPKQRRLYAPQAVIHIPITKPSCIQCLIPTESEVVFCHVQQHCSMAGEVNFYLLFTTITPDRLEYWAQAEQGMCLMKRR
jgi:hypothetical protein